jgi:hypothetical protein
MDPASGHGATIRVDPFILLVHWLVHICGVNVDVLPLGPGRIVYIPGGCFHVLYAPRAARVATGYTPASDLVQYVRRQASPAPEIGVRPWAGMDGFGRDATSWNTVGVGVCVWAWGVRVCYRVWACGCGCLGARMCWCVGMRVCGCVVCVGVWLWVCGCYCHYYYYC